MSDHHSYTHTTLSNSPEIKVKIDFRLNSSLNSSKAYDKLITMTGKRWGARAR